jgi:REP element-mobilizing transposase RayT
MRRAKNGVFVHLAWATWDRLPLLKGEVERAVHRAVSAECGKLQAEVLAIGGVDDHVHLLVRLPATLAVAKLAQQVKGASAHLVTHMVAPDQFFKWQGAYGAFSVSPHDLDTVCAYIRHQHEHHAAGSLVAEWEHVSDDDVATPAVTTNSPTF